MTFGLDGTVIELYKPLKSAKTYYLQVEEEEQHKVSFISR